MNVGFDVAQTCQERAGCGWAADLLIKALVETAPRTTFYLYHQFGKWLNWNTSRGTRINLPNVSAPLRHLAPPIASRIWSAAASGKSLLPGAPDIVHSNCFQAPQVAPAKLVYTVYDVSFWIHPEFTTEQNRIACMEGVLDAIERSSGFVFISESSKAEFCRLFPGLLEKRSILHKVAPLGSRFAPVENARTGPPDTEWLAVGSLEPRKNYETILAAQKLYWNQSKRKRRLTIAGGKGWKSHHVLEEIKQMSEKGMVRYLGYIPDNQLQELYRSSFALLFPSHYEGFGLPVVEAMSQACPVITRNNSSLPEVGGLAAIYVENDPTEIAEAMLRLEQDPKRYGPISESSLAQAHQFSWANTAAKVLELYEELTRISHAY
jgi:glycosyltransferase involved in cell wall biosynthesis